MKKQAGRALYSNRGAVIFTTVNSASRRFITFRFLRRGALLFIDTSPAVFLVFFPGSSALRVAKEHLFLGALSPSNETQFSVRAVCCRSAVLEQLGTRFQIEEATRRSALVLSGRPKNLRRRRSSSIVRGDAVQLPERRDKSFLSLFVVARLRFNQVAITWRLG